MVVKGFDSGEVYVLLIILSILLEAINAIEIGKVKFIHLLHIETGHFR